MSEQIITVRPQSLKPGRESATFLLGSFLLWLVRALIVWGFLAVFFPALGATYVMVLLGLWALTQALPINRQEMIQATKAAVK